MIDLDRLPIDVQNAPLATPTPVPDLYERVRRRTRRRRALASIAAVSIAAVSIFGVAAGRSTENDTVVFSGGVDTTATDPTMTSVTSAPATRFDLLAVGGSISIALPADATLTDHIGQLADGTITNGSTSYRNPALSAGESLTEGDQEMIATSPIETLSFQLGEKTEAPQQITVVFWRAGLDLGSFEPLDDARFHTAAYFDSPPDEEWNKSVILTPDDELVVFVNGRNLERETLLAVAASLQVNR